VTVISDSCHPHYLRFFKASCDHFALELVALFAEERIKPSRFDRVCNWLRPRERGFQLKDALVLDYLSTQDPDELVLVSDGYDAFFLAGAAEIERKFRAFNSPLVVSAEENCHPDKGLARHYPPSSGSMKFLNAGGMIGRVAALCEALKLVRSVPSPARFSWSNQYRWTKLFLERPTVLALDYASDIFFCTAVPHAEYGRRTWDPSFWEQTLIRQGRVEMPSGASPCHVHFNGPIASQLDTLTPALRKLCPWMPEDPSIEGGGAS